MAALLVDTLTRLATDRPHDEALTSGGLRLTWSQWHERVRRATGALASAGIGRGDRVAVIDRNHLAALDMIMAAGALGAAAVLPNWRLTDEELASVLADCSPRLVVLGSAFSDRADVVRTAATSIERIVHLDAEYEAWIAQAAPRDAAAEASPTDTVLVMYTSGTTGAAKGVMFSHEGLAENARVSVIRADAHAGDRILVSMPFFHIGGTASALAAIDAGLPFTILAEPTPGAIMDAIAAGCTRVFLVPAVIARLVDADERERQALASLALVVYGGSPCPRPILEAALAALPTTAFVQSYGMTELCGTVTTLTDAATRDPRHPERLASAGQVIEGVEVRIVDPGTSEDVDPGSAGELWFRTSKRMLGYLGRPDDTATVIVDGDWVRTGDIGRMDEDGFIFVEDRLKDVIITGGENVYSPEVEAVLAAHPSVAEVAVIGLPDPRMGETVTGVVTPASDAGIDPEALIAHAREHLAGFKCPRRIEVVDELPRNVSGKVMKRELRDRFTRDGGTAR